MGLVGLCGFSLFHSKLVIRLDPEITCGLVRGLHYETRCEVGERSALSMGECLEELCWPSRMKILKCG